MIETETLLEFLEFARLHKKPMTWVAEQLKVSRQTLYNYLKKLNLQKKWR